MASDTRVVYGRSSEHGFTAAHKALIQPAESAILRRPGWRYVIYRQWVSWKPNHRSRWFADRDECQRAANAHLDRIEASDDGDWIEEATNAD